MQMARPKVHLDGAEIPFIFICGFAYKNFYHLKGNPWEQMSAKDHIMYP